MGVKKPDQSKLIIFGCPSGRYYPKGFKPISLSCAVDAIRSAPKGTGAFKIGGYSIFYSVIMHQLFKLHPKSLITIFCSYSG
ncbi:MAG: hypothetical protein ACKO96_15985, partial [Flammeovirgaceae bacterium]